MLVMFSELWQQSRPGKQANTGKAIYPALPSLLDFTWQDAISGACYWLVLTHDDNTSLFLSGPDRFISFSSFPVEKARERTAGWTSSRQTRSTHPIFSVFFPRNLSLRSEMLQNHNSSVTETIIFSSSQLNVTNFNNLSMKSGNFIVESIYLTVLVVVLGK